MNASGHTCTQWPRFHGHRCTPDGEITWVPVAHMRDFKNRRPSRLYRIVRWLTLNIWSISL